MGEASQHPELEDFGEMILRSDEATGYIRVDWHTPGGLSMWEMAACPC